MRRKTKGEMTKERIYNSAKELFYKQGYNTTTIQQIADHSETTLGSMTYHFATKETFVAKIFDVYLNSIHESLNKKLIGYKPINSFETHFYLTMVWYHHLLNDQHVNNFYYEISQNDSLYPHLHGKMGEIYHDFVRDYNLRVRPIDFDALLIADFGARRELTRAFCEKRIKMPVEDFSILIITNTARCLGIPQKSIYRVGYEALLFFREHDFSEIKLLI